MTDEDKQRILTEDTYRAELELENIKAQNKLMEAIIKRLEEKYE